MGHECPFAILTLCSGDGPMAFRAICVALLLASLPVAGCGTVANVVKCRPDEGGKTPFGGVRHDLSCIRKAASGEIGFRTHSKTEAEQYPQMILMLFCAADLPFSLIGDVLTWPYAMAYSVINQPTPTPPVILLDAPVTQPMPLPTLPELKPMPLPSLPEIKPMPIPIPPKS
jgi:uncharacterized protein YceK